MSVQHGEISAERRGSEPAPRCGSEKMAQLPSGRMSLFPASGLKLPRNPAFLIEGKDWEARRRLSEVSTAQGVLRLHGPEGEVPLKVIEKIGSDNQLHFLLLAPVRVLAPNTVYALKEPLFPQGSWTTDQTLDSRAPQWTGTPTPLVARAAFGAHFTCTRSYGWYNLPVAFQLPVDENLLAVYVKLQDERGGVVLTDFLLVTGKQATTPPIGRGGWWDGDVEEDENYRMAVVPIDFAGNPGETAHVDFHAASESMTEKLRRFGKFISELVEDFEQVLATIVKVTNELRYGTIAWIIE